MGVLHQGKPHYGYSLVRALSEAGTAPVSEGTVYPILSRLDRDGLVRSEWVESAQGPPRKYYQLTSLGRQLFEQLREELAVLVGLVNRESEDPQPSEAKGRRLAVKRA